MKMLKSFFRFLSSLWARQTRSNDEILARGLITLRGHTREICIRRKVLPLVFSSLEKVAISCCGCGQPILPGELVLRSKRGDTAELYGACCTEMGAVECTGRWTVHGYVELSLKELCESY